MAPNLSKYLTKNNAYVVAAAATALWIISSRSRKQKKSSRKISKKVEEEVKYMITEKKQPTKVKAYVDKQFLKNIIKLLKIAIPGWNSSEIGYLILIAGSLVSRSLCDIYVIYQITKIESALISMDKKRFMRQLLVYLVSLPFISIVNNLLKFSTGSLRIKLRTNMTNHLYEEYLKNYTYYRMTNLDNRIVNADQLLTVDIDKFCDGVTEFYCNTTKPFLDIAIYLYKLNTNLGFGTPALMVGYLALSGVILTNLRKPTGPLTVIEQKLEGEYRHINSRIITHAEEIAFYQGNLKEKSTVMASFNKLIRHLRKSLHFHVLMGIIDNIITKYFAFFMGYIAMAMPFITGSHGLSQAGQEERQRTYYANGSMLVRLGQAIGRLILAGRALTRLAGFTVRVIELKEVLTDLNDGKYQRTMVTGSKDVKTNEGKLIFKDKIIKFDKVPIVTPNGDVLIKELSMEVKSGMNVLVCGPNGAGKSSLFRILGQLWPLLGGELTKPPRNKLFYIPQKPYMTLGSLRDQITYPQSRNEATRRGCTDSKLREYLKLVELEYLLEREGGFDAVEDWLEVLSGGEKQRIAMARLFYHAPQFAILDECTSAVSLDVEESMYGYCRRAGITLLTVSHRKSLWKHHEFVLYLDGRGSYTFEPIKEGMEQFGS
ncbi:hypothetical protein ILUMI_23200 [Ignelater luminosus]|uniref:ABC transporter domain-containing protein n=1 Tax=Ignelater luminosus TaxID=2038154 RepID=A0A8K0FZU4_IGNLU|nr:hypothetical protein ILUMI_23200 [Ignelater luminosus]